MLTDLASNDMIRNAASPNTKISSLHITVLFY